MKGFIVVDRLNDIQFLDTDKELAKHINEQAKESGLLPVCIEVEVGGGFTCLTDD